VFLSAASRLLPRGHWSAFMVPPATLFRWHRLLVAKHWTFARPPGRPSIAPEVRALIVRFARENPRWGYQRIVGELKGLGILVSATTVKKILRDEGLGPTSQRRGLHGEHSCVRRPKASSRWISSPSIRCGSSDCMCCSSLKSACAVSMWPAVRHTRTMRGSRNRRGSRLAFVEQEKPVRFLIRDRDRKFTISFDAVFEAQDVRVVRTLVHAPEANGIAERFVRTVRSECLDWLLILNARHLEHTIRSLSIITTAVDLTGASVWSHRMVHRQSQPKVTVN
jgi:putative transposase